MIVAYSLQSVQANDSFETEKFHKHPLLGKSRLHTLFESKNSHDSNDGAGELDHCNPDVGKARAVRGSAVRPHCVADDGGQPDDNRDRNVLQHCIPGLLRIKVSYYT